MVTRRVATVLGGSGFIGRYVVKRLTEAGYVVRVGVRDPEAANFLKPAGGVGQVAILYTDLNKEGTVARALEGADLAVNLVGILSERRAGDFQRVQAEGAGLVARKAMAYGVKRLVHISAIGAAEGPSVYGTTKARGEALVREAYPAATILRPSIVFGPEDQFFNRFASMAIFTPIMPVISGGAKFQPVYVGDVADAVMQALARPDAAGTTYELGGPRVATFRELLAWIVAQTGRRRRLVNVPTGIAGLLASLPFTGLTRDQLIMLKRDNVVDPSMPGLSELGILPTPMELVVPTYLSRFRKSVIARPEMVPNRT